MNFRCTLAVTFVLVSCTMLACEQRNPAVQPDNDPAARFPQFQPTAKSQRAVFVTEPWTGGGGDPLQTKIRGRTEKLDGLPVYLLEDTQQLIRKNVGPQPPDIKHARILVDAQIHLERTTVKRTTELGDSSRKVYKVVIEKLNSSQWYTDQ
jgi:hypothetical protein